MIKLLKIIPAKQKSKKWTAYFKVDNKEKAVSFGQAGAKDYTLMNDKTSKFYEPDKKKREKPNVAWCIIIFYSVEFSLIWREYPQL